MWLNKLYLPGYQLIRHFSHKMFSCKTAYAIFKVVYQASHIPKIRKIYGIVAKKCSKMHIFHTFFAIFGQKNFFFKNPASSVFWNHKKLPWYQKSEKTMEPFERNPSGRTHGRTDGRKYESKSIVPPKFLGRSNKSIFASFFICLCP